MTIYKSRGDLLIAAGESIKMQESAGVEPVCKHMGVVCIAKQLHFDELARKACSYEFPLCVVEGKAVFVCDDIFVCGLPYRVREGDTNFGGWSWNPPKPRTVMVELLREDAEYWINYNNGRLVETSKHNVTWRNFFEACLKALESDK